MANWTISYDEFSNAVTNSGFRTKPSRTQFDNFLKGYRGGISSKIELAMFLANCIHESSGLIHKEELDKSNGYNKPEQYSEPWAKRWKELLSKYPGRTYYGRGYIQLTWIYNYYQASEGIFNDGNKLCSNPSLVATDDAIAWKSAFWYWKEKVHSQVLPHIISRSLSQESIKMGFEVSIKAINIIDTEEQKKSRRNIFTNVRKAFGV